MIGIILGILGLAGGGGIAALIAKFGLKVVLGTARSYAKRVPPKVWYAIAIIAALVAAYFVHQHYAHKALDAAYARGVADEHARQERENAKARAEKQRIETHGREITQKVEATNVKATDDIHSRARDQRLRVGTIRITGGPLPGVSGAASGGDEHGNGVTDAGLGGPLLAVPALELVDRAEQCDVNTENLKALRNWIKLESQAFSVNAKSGGAR